MFLSANQGLAVMVAGGVPLAWRQFALTTSSEGLAILSAARTLQTQLKHYGIEASTDYAMIFGREDLHERLRQEQFPSDLGTRVIWHEGPALEGRATALGLALGCLTPAPTGFDLSRHLKPRPAIAEIFPWGELAFVAFLILCMGVMLGIHSIGLSDKYASVKLEAATHKCLTSGKSSRLEKDEKELEKKVEAASKFVGSRVLWTTYARDIAAGIPANAQLVLFQGVDELEASGKAAAAPKKSLLLQATAPSEGGAVPREIDTFLDELRRNKVLKQDFASVELAGIKRSESRGKGGQSSAAFSIVCLPKSKNVAGTASAAGTKGGE
jgi:hypothetical protein